ncbi:MAG: heme-binding protein [Planctomycetes bacterium]|nr:heme-binding protein [Planctomycetota bacterium]
MKTNRLILLSILLSLPFLLYSCAVGIEKPKYTILEKQGQFELRQYPSCLVAETVVDADFNKAGNIAFGRLFKYISGDNRKQVSIPMTAPVSQTGTSEKIAMTAPVNMQQTQGKYAVSFLMPSQYTLETLPVPSNEAVVIKEVPVRKIAAIRYSGTWSQKRYEAKKASLNEFIQKKGLSSTGEPVFARYDPPFQLWFLRRNEVLIPVE